VLGLISVPLGVAASTGLPVVVWLATWVD
jgi:hypothetical protein